MSTSTYSPHTKTVVSIIDDGVSLGFVAPRSTVSLAKLIEVLEDLDFSIPAEKKEVESRFTASKAKGDWVDGEALAKSLGL